MDVRKEERKVKEVSYDSNVGHQRLSPNRTLKLADF